MNVIDLTLKPIGDAVDVAVHAVPLVEINLIASLRVEVDGKGAKTNDEAEVRLHLCIRDLREEEREGNKAECGQDCNALEHAILVKHVIISMDHT